MIKTIQLDKKGARLVNREPFLLPDKLQFDFENIGYDLSNAFITFKNGEKSEHLKIVSPLLVPESVLFAGKLETRIDIWYNGKIIKTFYLMPLQIVETDVGIEVLDILYEYQKTLSEFGERLIALEKKHEFYK